MPLGFWLVIGLYVTMPHFVAIGETTAEIWRLLWPPNRAGHYILQLWFLLAHFFLFSSPILNGRKLDVYHTSAHECEFRMQVWQCAARGSLKIQDIKGFTTMRYISLRFTYLLTYKHSLSAHHRTTLSGMSSQLGYVSTIRKNVKDQYLLHMSAQYGELRPTNGWGWLAGLGHPSKF